MKINSLQDLREHSRLIVFECVAGSHAYGTNIETSDKDTRGVYMLPSNLQNSYYAPKDQLGDDKSDVVFYNFKRFLQLLEKANPNMIDLLYMPKECVIRQSYVYEKVLKKRDIFLTKQTYQSHFGYATAQIKKARGSNKRVYNPQKIERPQRSDYCNFINPHLFSNTVQGLEQKFGMPFRPKPIDFDLSKCHAAGLEGFPNCYRIYHYGEGAKGVFRGLGEDAVVVCESIPKEDEWDKFIGIMSYNEDAYKRAVQEWSQYWDWMKNRNESRWVDQEKGKLDYDQKNMMHCIRILMSVENLLEYGEPVVRFSGEKLQFLRDIRAGLFCWDDLMGRVEDLKDKVESAYQNTVLPDHVPEDEIVKLYQDVSDVFNANLEM